MIKDFKDTAVTDAFDNLRLMFEMLDSLLKPLPMMATTRSEQHVVGKVKKGMPGANSFGLHVEVNPQTFFATVMAVFALDAPAVSRSS